ncbi:MAG: hypothetical protein ACRC8K_07880, partial [Waterburya sp.]
VRFLYFHKTLAWGKRHFVRDKELDSRIERFDCQNPISFCNYSVIRVFLAVTKLEQLYLSLT